MSLENMKCHYRLGYCLGFAFYNLGGSVPIGLGRVATSVYYLIGHIPTTFCGSSNLQGDSKRMQRRFMDYRSSEMQVNFWFAQMGRGASEIFLPIIAPLIWSLVDLTKSSKGNTLYAVSKFKINIIGINDLLVAREWEKETSAALGLQS